MVTDDNQSNHGDDFIMYINIKSPCGTPETHILSPLYVNQKISKKTKFFGWI